MKAGWLPPGTFSGRDLSEVLRVKVGFPGVCDSFTILSRVLLLRFTSV